MKFEWYLTIVLISLLQGCASPKMSQELQQGKITFEQGEYKEAFRQLLPVAVKGRKEAQYAVGYMYYYGYGVSQDSESGIFWMTKAAEQQYPPAITALNLIQQHNALPLSAPHAEAAPQNNYVHPTQVSVATPQSYSADPVLQALPARPRPPIHRAAEHPYSAFKAAPQKAIVAHKTPSSLTAKSATLTEKTAPYTLQLFGSYHLADAEKLKTHLAVNHPMYVWHTKHNDKDWYVLTYGHYQDVHHAALAKNNLPIDLHKMNPWIRQTDTLKVII